MARRREVEVLLACARTPRRSDTADQIRALLREETDWKYLLRVAREHRVVPLLFSHLNATCPEAVPEAALNELRNHSHENTRRNLLLTGELLKLLNLFEAHGICVIPFKGPTLAAMAYGNLALREFDDLDILVRKQDVPRAEELLVSMEYRSQCRLNGEQQAAFSEISLSMLLRAVRTRLLSTFTGELWRSTSLSRSTLSACGGASSGSHLVVTPS